MTDLAKQLARELRRRCNTKLSLLHQSAWYEACNELEKFADSVISESQRETLTRQHLEGSKKA